jgi:hypothetical protein
VTANTGDAREATLTLSVEGVETPVTLTVTQAAAPAIEEPTLEVSEESLDFDSEGGYKSLTVTTNQESFSIVEGTPDWVKAAIIEPSEGSTHNLKIEVEPNADGIRTATVTLAAGNKTTTLTVTQAASPDAPEPTLVWAVRDEWSAESRYGYIDGGWYGSGEPNLLFDGDPEGTGWHATLELDPPYCLVVDMKTSNTVHAVQLQHVQEAIERNWFYINNVQVYLSDTPFDPNDDPSATMTPAATSQWSIEKGNPFTIDLPIAATGQYLILYFLDSNQGRYIGFTELDVQVEE